MDRFWICGTLKCIRDDTIHQDQQNVSNWRSIQHTKADIVRWNEQLVAIHLSHKRPILSALSNDGMFVFQGASKSLQSFVKALAWGSEASGWRAMSTRCHGSTCLTFAMMKPQLFELKLKICLLKNKMCHNFTCDWHQLLWEQIQRCYCCRLVTTLWQHLTVLAEKDPLLLTSITLVLSDRVMKVCSGKGCLNISLYSFRCAGRWSRKAITCHQYLLSQSKTSYFPFSVHLSVCLSFISIYCYLTSFLPFFISFFSSF